MMAVFLPAAAGRPSLRFTAAVISELVGQQVATVDRRRDRERVVDELGAVDDVTVPSGFCEIVPTSPLIGVFGGGGAVVPTVSFRRTGVVDDPM